MHGNSIRKIPLSRLRDELNAGKPVLLVPIYVALQPPSDDFVLVPVAGVQPQARAELLHLDICGDSGVILVEAKRRRA